MATITISKAQKDWVIDRLEKAIEDSIKRQEEWYQISLKNYNESNWLVKLFFGKPTSPLLRVDGFSPVGLFTNLLKTVKDDNWEYVTFTASEWSWIRE